MIVIKGNVTKNGEGFVDAIGHPIEMVDLVGIAHKANIIDLQAGRTPGYASIKDQPSIALTKTHRTTVPIERSSSSIHLKIVRIGALKKMRDPSSRCRQN